MNQPQIDAVAVLREALKAAIDEKCNYMQSKKLGDPEIESVTIMGRKALAATDRAATVAKDGGDVRGPLTDAQRDHVRNLYRTLHHLGPGAMEDVVRHASVNGYVNGRLDFGITEAQRAAVGEILGMVANDHMATADIRRIYAKSWECAWSVVSNMAPNGRPAISAGLVV